MNDSSRNQGVAICAAAAVLGIVFLWGLLNQAWWSVAIPIAILLAFVLGLTFWVGWTIATIQVDPEPEVRSEPPAPPPSSPPAEESSAGATDSQG